MKMDKENVTVKTQSSGNLMVVSLILMVLSCVLFVGTTLAWFTDQTSGGVNRIQAGNLEAVLVIGEGDTKTSVPLDPPSGAQPTNTTAVSLKLRKATAENNVVTIASDDNAVWNPGDIFISDVMQVKKVADSVPFKYKLEMSFDPLSDEEGAKASEYIDFRIVDVSTISTVSGDTRTYKYADIAAYFGGAGGDGEGSAQGGTKEPGTPPTPIWLLADEENGASGQTQPPTKVFSSELEEDQTQVQFVILAKLKPNVSVDTNSTDTIENPFNLIVTVKQRDAEFEQAAAEPGGAS